MDSPLIIRSKQFALEIIKVCNSLKKTEKYVNLLTKYGNCAIMCWLFVAKGRELI